MHEHIVGYVLKALDPETQQAVEDHLRDHPEAQAQVEAVQRALAPLAADAEAPDPPPGLMLSTLARIAEHRCRTIPAAPPPTPYQRSPTVRRWFRRADVLAAAALLLLIGGVGVPALLHQWHAYQRRACANNMRGIWDGLAAYSDNNDGKFPAVAADGPRGVPAHVVAAVHEYNPTATFWCPAQGQRKVSAYSNAELKRLYDQQRDEFYRAARELTGDYAIYLGFRDGEQLRDPDRDMGDAFPLLADRLAHAADPGNSLNHGGGGQNVLFTGGHVTWVTERTVGPDRDDIYLNQQRQLRAGLNPRDPVLAPGDASPCSNK